MMSQEIQATANNMLSAKQWAVVAGVVVAAAPAGPIVQAGAAIGTAGACYVSNVMGWEGSSASASHSTTDSDGV
jgi:hypothetical protein